MLTFKEHLERNIALAEENRRDKSYKWDWELVSRWIASLTGESLQDVSEKVRATLRSKRNIETARAFPACQSSYQISNCFSD